MIISKRVIYKGGTVRPENEGVEISCICECDSCKQRYEYTKYRELRNVSFKNHASIVVFDTEKLKEAIEFAEKWKCKDGSKELDKEYLTFL